MGRKVAGLNLCEGKVFYREISINTSPTPFIIEYMIVLHKRDVLSDYVSSPLGDVIWKSNK